MFKQRAFVTLLAGLCCLTTARAGSIPGDLNGDGEVNIIDFSLLQREFSGLTCVHRNSMADLDDNGCVDLSDYVVMFHALLGCGPLDGCGLAGTCVGGSNVGLPCGSDDDCPGGACGGLPPCTYASLNGAVDSNQCETLGDVVERRLCELGIKLDGSVRDAEAAGAASLVDTTPSFGGTPVAGPFGDDDEPVIGPSPNGFNFAGAVLLFVPDDRQKFCSVTTTAMCAVDGDCPGGESCQDVDRSFLYAGWNISDAIEDPLFAGDGIPPRQFDTDHNGDASDLAKCTPGDPNCPGTDLFGEQYTVILQGCTSSDVFDPAQGPVILGEREPQFISGDNDARLRIEMDECEALSIRQFSTSGLDLLAFPTADGATIQTNECIDVDVDRCAARRCVASVSGARPGVGYSNDPCETTADCPGGEFCVPDNDVELVIKGVETHGAFGPHAAATPDSVEARENRVVLAQMLASMRGGTPEDGPGEDTANSALRVSMPQLEVSKRVRCADSGQTEFTSGPVKALIGSSVEFEITIENVGNEDLTVTVEDVLEEIGAQAALAGCSAVCDFLEAELTSPRRGLVNHPIDFANAVAPPVCDPGTDPENCLNPEFFIPSCAVADPQVSFLKSVDTGTSAELGTLLGASVERADGACAVTGGDRIVLRFAGIVGVADGVTVDEFCVNRTQGDCRNRVTVTGSLVGDTEEVARDEAGVVDTDGEIQGGFVDDNDVAIDILCREITFDKFVGLAGSDQGSFVTGTQELTLPSVPPAGSVDIEYLYVVQNVGETDESVTISDAELCSDIAAVQAVFPGEVVYLDCPLCTDPPVGSIGPIQLPAKVGADLANCIISFLSQDALRDFLLRDDGREPCNENDPGLSGSDCYRNCASASADAINLEDICRPPVETITRTSFTTICNAPCEIEIVKEVRCLPECDAASLGAEEGWVAEPSILEVTPGACLQYRIVVENASADPNALCALKFDDLMSESGNFQSGPSNVQLVGRSCTNLTFSSAFNWDGNEVTCKLNAPLNKNESVTVLFEARLADGSSINAAATPTNQIMVMGASESDCPDVGEPSFSCMDDSSIAIDIKTCDLEIAKDVTCDDPRDSGAIFESDIVDALPGSVVGFRILVENTGEANIPSVEIADTLDCASWYVPNSVVADVNGVDVTSCVCPPGGCATIGALNGVKDLTPCLAGGMAPTEILRITFEVKVPDGFAMMGTDEDCVNSVTVGGTTALCQSDDANPCPERTDLARINVDLPEINCDKTVCADFGTGGQSDGSCTDPGDLPPASMLQIDGNMVMYPVTLIYEFTVQNKGETDFIDARICDMNFAADLNAAMSEEVVVVSCDLDLVSGCVSVGALGNGDVGDPPSSKTAFCSVRFESEAAWLTLAELSSSGREVCYSNSASAAGDVDGEIYCPREANLTFESDSCSAEACIEMQFIPTMSEWGMVILTLLLLIGAKLRFGYADRRLA